MPVAKKTTTKAVEVNTTAIEAPEVENTSGASMQGFDMKALMETLNGLQSTISNLQTRLDDAEKRNNELEKMNETLREGNILPEVKTSTDDKTERLLEYLTNKKSDREVVIVHNREMIPGLSTHIELTGLTIDFRTLGEERVISWQQFEECVSRYRKWFEEEIILLSDKNADIAQNYNIPCVKRQGAAVINRSDLTRLGNMDVHTLEDYYNNLTEEDKAFVCSYWLGKCYEKDPKFYDRYKVELLNRLNRKGVFDNVLAVMNNDFLRDGETTKIN